MSRIKITANEMRYMALFESISGAMAKDCIIDDDQKKLVFITKAKEAGFAVGRNGTKIKMLKRATGKNIEIIEYAENIQDFIKNAFMPARIREVRLIEKVDKTKMAIVQVEECDKGLAIGRGGERVERIRNLLRKYFNITNLIIS
tara:strand:+ start:22 stop:456 length:435 start_codon:yes stop_codon:yes gene_type:complete